VGIILSLIVMAVGAILTWGINSSGGSVDVDVVGIILMIVGFVLFLISLLLWNSWWGAGFWGWGPGPGPGGPYEGGAVVRRRAYWPTRRRTTYVDEEPPPPPGP
jgi:hypothetical protein